ncbi:MAG: ribulose-phosphate 3-epimerase [Dehalococcoidia bacterium]|nr:ribulose-phosphate 3-epimerase [Dehalococcoidia bacterium]
MRTAAKVKIAPSILSADFGRLGAQVEEATAAGADYIHVDVMDGHFVPNITLGPLVVEAVRRHTHLPLDVHLMIERPERYIEDFARAIRQAPGERDSGILTVHVEACPHLHRTLQQIKATGVRAGVTLNPGTPLSAIEEALPYVDLVLVMSVNPGFGGQSYIPSVTDKIRRLRRMLDEGGYGAELEVDGGIAIKTAPLAVAAGARVLVAGSALFNKEKSVKQALADLRASIESAGH